MLPPRPAALTLLLATIAVTACAAAASPSFDPSSPPRYVAPAVRVVSGCVEHDGLPDRACTPGATDPAVTQADITTTICRLGYTKTVRPPYSVTEPIKVERMRAYGITGSLHDYELDHLIPLEVGGAPSDVANLWPEPWTGSRGASAKDVVERQLHDEVCAHRISLADAQRRFAVDWRHG
jgi:hypothetical protein